jgi:hypothetical protein
LLLKRSRGLSKLLLQPSRPAVRVLVASSSEAHHLSKFKQMDAAAAGLADSCLDVM